MERRRGDLGLYAALGLLAYLPVFLSRSGMVAADTKQYLYLDPGRLTAGAASMWDPNTGMGTVTHQNIGYLLPMGPYYSLVQWLGIPMWVGQRVWMGTVLFAAGSGVAFCARRLGLEGPGRAVAAAAYMLSPYVLDYLDRISAILMPWAALGWMVGLTASAARSGRWRPAALFALVVALVGGVNATSILLVIIAPAVWLAHAVWITREIDLRRAAVTAARLGLLSFVVSLWWAAGLWAEGRYGINILRVTETVPTVSSTSSASEVLRGLGYWYFYGWDKVQPWTVQSLPYTQSPWLIAVSFALPLLSVAVGFCARWVHRSYCLALIGASVVVAVGAYPFSSPSAVGSLVKDASAGSTLALAMRSVDRVVPVLVLGLALMLGGGIASVRLRRPGLGWVTTGISLALVAADLPALWTGGLIASNLVRPGQIPSYWNQAAAALNAGGSTSRVLGLPGEDFAAYSWGVTADPVPVGLLTRPYVSRQVVPSGTPASANLLQALDEPIQEGTLYPPALVPVARLMSVGDVLLQSDLQYERYHLPLPQVLYQTLTSPSAGLGAPTSYGPPEPAAQIRYPLDSEPKLGLPTGTAFPPALSVFAVADPRALVRTEGTATPVVIAGDGAGVVEAAGAGLLTGSPTLLYAAALPAGSGGAAVPAGSTLVVTDTNALAGHLWGSLRDNAGQVDQPSAPVLTQNPSDYSLPVFPGQTTSDQTVAEVEGLAYVSANAYGDSLTYTPEDKPLNAFDGDPSTGWTFGAHQAVAGQRIQAGMLQPVTASQVTLTQIPQPGPIKRRITSVTLLFDGAHPVTVPLDSRSLQAPGQTVTFPARTFSTFTLVADSATGGAGRRYDGLPQVGFTSISIPGVGPATETLRLPSDLLGSVGASSLSDGLDILMQRSRAVEPPRHDPETYMSRTFTLPTARTFTVSGTAEINSGDSDYLINQLIGLTPQGRAPDPSPAGSSATAKVVAANSSTRLDGDRRARSNSAFDGDPATAWIAETGPQSGEWLSANLSEPVTFDHLDLQVLNDGRHSLPSVITISTPTASRTVQLSDPPVGYGRAANSVSRIAVDFPALTGSSVRVTVDTVHQVRALDYYSTYAGLTDILPVGLAEVGLPGVSQPAAPAEIPSTCTGGLISIDGHPVDVEVAGSVGDALDGGQLHLQACGDSLDGVSLGPGRHTVVTSLRLPLGWSVDQLWLSSAAGGMAATPAATLAVGGTSPTPALTVTGSSRTSTTVTVEGNGQPFWLVLGQSFSSGFTAAVRGGPNLGGPHLIDAYANGWLVPASAVPAGRTVTIDIDWAPQQVIWAAIGVSGAGLGASVLLAVWPERWGRPRRRRRVPAERGVPASARPRAVTRRSVLGLEVTAVAGWRRLLITAAAWGLVAAAVSRPLIGAVAALAVVIGGRVRSGRVLLRLAAVGLLVGLVWYSVDQQVHRHYWPSIEWPADMGAANALAWWALALLGSDLVCAWVRAAARSGGEG